MYDNTEILPIYQKLLLKPEQWKESAEQEANKKENRLPIKCTVYSMTTQKCYQYIKNYCKSSGQWKESAEQKANWLPIKRTVYCMTTKNFTNIPKTNVKAQSNKRISAEQEVNYGKILQPDRNKDATDPRNWVHGKNQSRWKMNRCNLGYTNQSKEANKKANWLPMKQKWQKIWSGICHMIENTAHITAYLQRIERMIREKDKPCEKT